MAGILIVKNTISRINILASDVLAGTSGLVFRPSDSLHGRELFSGDSHSHRGFSPVDKEYSKSIETVFNGFLWQVR